VTRCSPRISSAVLVHLKGAITCSAAYSALSNRIWGSAHEDHHLGGRGQPVITGCRSSCVRGLAAITHPIGLLSDDYAPVMANRHFGKFADVWKHLVVDEVLENMKPARYAETHAGSGAYAMVHDAERQYGVLGFLDDLASSTALSTAAFSRLTSAFVQGQPALYPGSALQAMTLLGDQCAYLLADMDPVSVDDLRAWSHRLNLSHCEVAQRDGMTAVREWLGDPDTTVVHIDPFEPFTHEDGGPSAIEMAAEVADAGHTLVYWYGSDNPKQRSWAMDEIRTLTRAPLWCGNFMVTSSTHEPATDGDLGEGTTPGTGSGVVLANVASPLIDRCLYLAHALVDAYDGRTLPNGEPGHLNFEITTTP
jgi:23S rRNA A2030 N6-methylase RlmJ